ncbi:ATP-binding protein [Rhizobium sp. AAP43]|uniref:sensor histidine kinase n=1 Tax=Rhizobium sp. AAP43 TaxID=1523420 RepID=UPI0006B932BA|nr:ATP-binding protein [Rhizobium sp. AAP43]KPF46389.1 ATPase [Rhizobium sp. AAP43]
MIATSPSPAFDQTAKRRTGLGVSWLIYLVIALATLAAGLFLAGEAGMRNALSTLADDLDEDAALKRALLQATLERPRALPLVLAADRQVSATLGNPTPEALDGLNRKLEALVLGTKTSVIYVVGRNGSAIAASNWREADSFVGNDYTFREYFKRGMAVGSAEHYALGSVSKRPGLYLSQRVVDDSGAALGVVVVKVEFDGLERDWGRSDRTTFVTDQRGIVLITSRPPWRFFSTTDIPPPERAALRESLQFGEASLERLPIRPLPERDGRSMALAQVTDDVPAQAHLALVLDVPGTPWQMHVLAPAGSFLETGMWQARLAALLVMLPLFALAALLLYRRNRMLRRQAADQAARDELEREVTARTRELTIARDRLQTEIGEHRATETRLQTVQHDLVQANRLAILGQVAAGVAHEINQPVATIRAYADNARTFLDRGQSAPAAENLGLIGDLTDRIGAITNELRGFARKGRAAAEPVDLKTAVDGALLLLRSRFSGSLDMLAIDAIAPEIRVMANRIRLEQVLINLLQNALEALETQADGRITVQVGTGGPDEVTVIVADNGPGIPPTILDNLFTPFNTSKEAGLGLGLVICKDIVSDYGGRIAVDSSPAGTTFTVTLKRALS